MTSRTKAFAEVKARAKELIEANRALQELEAEITQARENLRIAHEAFSGALGNNNILTSAVDLNLAFTLSELE